MAINPATGFQAGSAADQQALAGAIPKKQKKDPTITGGVPINPSISKPTPVTPVAPVTPAPPVAPATATKKEPTPYVPTAEDYVQAEYNEGRETGDKFKTIFGTNPMSSSAEQVLQDLAASQKAEREFQLKSQELTKGINERQLAATKRESEAAQGASVAAFAQNREGAMSGTAQNVIGRYAGISNERMQTATDQVAAANLQMEEAQRQLREAQRSGQQNAIEQYRGAVAQADKQIKQANIDLANAESQALSEARQFQASERQNIETFTGLLDSGVQIDLAGVLNLSSQLGVPTDLATSYYAATDLIRKDKTLSSEQKQIELEVAKEDFNDRITGFQTKEAQKIRDYERLVKQGYDPTTLAVSMDIPNDKNPVYQAELASKVALAEINRAKASGRILDPMEQLEYAQALAEYAEMTGEGEVYIPGGTKYPITPTGTGVSVGAKDGEYGGQCGRFVNNVIGSPSFIKNSYEQKLSLINSQIPVPGMIGVAPAPGASQPYGHVFMVEKVNPDGTMDIVESNYVNKEVIGRRRVPVGMADGFIAPPNSKATTTKGTKGIDSASIAILNQKARGTGEKKYSAKEKEMLTQINNVFANPNSDLLEMLPLTAGGKDPSESEKKSIQAYSKVLSGVTQLEKTIAGTDPGGVFTAVTRIAQSKLPFQNKPSQIKAQITALIPQVARGVYGEVGVLTDTDIERYTQLLPTLNTTEAIQQSLLDLMYTSLYNGIESDLDGMARGKVDVSRFTGQVEKMRESRARLYGEAESSINEAESIWGKYNSIESNLYKDYGISN